MCNYNTATSLVAGWLSSTHISMAHLQVKLRMVFHPLIQVLGKLRNLPTLLNAHQDHVSITQNTNSNVMTLMSKFIPKLKYSLKRMPCYCFNIMT